MKYKIAFYAGKLIPVHAFTLDERPLGGTETALIRVAEHLAARGHDVTVFTSFRSPPISVPRYLYHTELLRERYDVLVSIQDWMSLFYGAQVRARLFWTGDGSEQYSNFGLGDRRVVEAVDQLLAVSTFHATTVCGESGFPIEKTTVIGNGIHPSYFSSRPTRDPHRLLYTSAPYRGLEHLGPIFEALRKKHPQLTLEVFSGMSIYDRERPFEGPLATKSREIIARISKIPGVICHEAVKQSELALEYLRSSIALYPCTVPETCCITALEAQAGGCVVVSSAIGALSETVGANGGIVVSGEPGKPEFGEAFISAVDSLLADRAELRRRSELSRMSVMASHCWEHVADRFELCLEKILKST